MARTTLSITVASSAGFRVHTGFDVAADTANGNDFDNDGSTFLAVRNSSGGSLNFVLKGPQLVDGTVIADVTASIGAGAIKWFGPFPTRIFNQNNQAGAVVGRVACDSAAGGIFLQCFRVPPVN
jgi:hypothetical protein